MGSCMNTLVPKAMHIRHLDSVEWNDGLEQWNGMVEWNGGMDWNGGMHKIASYTGSSQFV